MIKRRFSYLWISIFTVVGSGCAGSCFGGNSDGDNGCGEQPCNKSTCDSLSVSGGKALCDESGYGPCNIDCNPGLANCSDQNSCDTHIYDDSENCGTCGHSCGGGVCVAGQCATDAGPLPSFFAIDEDVENPGGIANDGIYVYYIKGDSLFAALRGSPTPPLNAIATGVTPVGGLALDDRYVYWASAGVQPTFDADASDDAGDDASGDASTDAGDALPGRGIFRVLKSGGTIEFLGDLDPLPGIAIANGNLFLNGRGDDAGVLGELTIAGDAGFQPLAAFSGNGATTRSIVPFAPGVAFLDQSDIDFVDLVDGGSRTLASSVNASAIVGTSSGPFYVSPLGPMSSSFKSIAGDAGGTVPFAAGDVSSSGPYVYIADVSTDRVLRYDTRALSTLPTIITNSTSVPLMLAADTSGVCWIEGLPSQTLFCSTPQ